MAGSVTVNVEHAANKTGLNYIVFSSWSLGSATIAQQGSGESFDGSSNCTIDLTSAPTVNDQDVLVAFQDPSSNQSVGFAKGTVVA